MKVCMKDGKVEDCKFEEILGSEAFWYSASKVLAQAVKRIYPATKCAAGSSTKDGYYYDFEFDFAFTAEHLKVVEDEMKKLVKENLLLRRFERSKEEVSALFSEEGEAYKLSIVRDMSLDEKICLCQLGDYVDLCEAPHLLNVNVMKGIKLTTIAGAYWQGNDKNKMLTRIYGVAFPKGNQLEEYLALQEEIKRRDKKKRSP